VCERAALRRHRSRAYAAVWSADPLLFSMLGGR
jgi:hypothetical protein